MYFHRFQSLWHTLQGKHTSNYMFNPHLELYLWSEIAFRFFKIFSWRLSVSCTLNYFSKFMNRVNLSDTICNSFIEDQNSAVVWNIFIVMITKLFLIFMEWYCRAHCKFRAYVYQWQETEECTKFYELLMSQ